MSAHRSEKGVHVPWRVVPSTIRRYSARQRLQRSWGVWHFGSFVAYRNRAPPLSSFAACFAQWWCFGCPGGRSHRYCPMVNRCRGQCSLGAVAQITSAQALTPHVVSHQTRSALVNCTGRPHCGRFCTSLRNFLRLVQRVGCMVRRECFVMGRRSICVLLSVRCCLCHKHCPVGALLQQPFALNKPISIYWSKRSPDTAQRNPGGDDPGFHFISSGLRLLRVVAYDIVQVMAGT
jgi:hypothetical protein